jgi:hypothetical protein
VCRGERRFFGDEPRIDVRCHQIAVLSTLHNCSHETDRVRARSVPAECGGDTRCATAANTRLRAASQPCPPP